MVESARIGKLAIRVRGSAPDVWKVRRVTLNGRPLDNWRVRHADIERGGELIFEMDASPVP